MFSVKTEMISMKSKAIVDLPVRHSCVLHVVCSAQGTQLAELNAKLVQLLQNVQTLSNHHSTVWTSSASGEESEFNGSICKCVKSTFCMPI